MKEIEKEIEDMINGRWPAAEGEQDTCWRFCRHIYKLHGRTLPATLHTLKKIQEPKVPCIVLINCKTLWHSGVVWPDGLHFIHAYQRDEKTGEYIICRDRLTGTLWKQFIEGYYDYDG